MSALWINGPLSVYESVSLRSFVRTGYDVTLYTYGPSLDAPTGVTLADAREIIPSEKIFENPFQRGTFAGFSNLFRYELLKSRKTIWIDTDVVSLGKMLNLNEGYLFGWESTEFINGAILGAPQQSEFVRRLIEEASKIEPSSFQWGTWARSSLLELCASRTLVTVPSKDGRSTLWNLRMFGSFLILRRAQNFRSPWKGPMSFIGGMRLCGGFHST